MSRWIEVRGGYVNLAHVVRMVPVGNPKTDWVPYNLELVNHEHVITRHPFTPAKLERLLATLVPATAGQKAVVIAYGGGDRINDRPTEVWEDWYPVVAWRIDESGWALPILPADASEASNCRVLIEKPDGGFIDPLMAEYVDLADAKKRILEEVQTDWDAAQAAKARAS